MPLRGAAKPRVETHPDYAFDYGTEAAELMARAGRPLDPWQVDAVTLTVAVRDDGKWACYEYCEWVARQNGKGGILEARVLVGFLLLGEELILWSAHLYKTAMELFRRMKALIRALGTRVKPNDDNLWLVDGILVKISNTNGDEGFERLDTGARVLFIARSAGGGRGMSGDVNIIDEAAFYTREQHSALLYTLSARPNPQIIYTSSPPLRGDTGEIMFELRRRGDPTAPRDPGDPPWEQDPSLGYRDWGLAGELEDLDGIDIDDLGLAAETNPALGIRITLETIQRELRSDRAGYPRERLGIWPHEIRGRKNGDIAELWSQLADRDADRPDDVAFAIDVSPNRSSASILMAGFRDDDLVQLAVVEHRPGTSWIAKRAAALKEKWNPLCFAIDGKSPVASLMKDFEEVGIVEPEYPDQPERGHLAVLSATDAATAWAMIVDAIREKRLRHSDDVPLNVAVDGATTRTLAGGSAWDRKGNTDITPLVAGTNAFWALLTLRDKVTAESDPGVYWL